MSRPSDSACQSAQPSAGNPQGPITSGGRCLMDETNRLRQLHHIRDAIAACDRIASPEEIEAARAEWERLRAPAVRAGEHSDMSIEFIAQAMKLRDVPPATKLVAIYLGEKTGGDGTAHGKVLLSELAEFAGITQISALKRVSKLKGCLLEWASLHPGDFAIHYTFLRG